MLEKSSVGNLF